MQAVWYDRYGSPDVIEIRTLDKPTPGPDEVLVRVVAASVNPADWHLMRGKPIFVRLASGFPRPKQHVLGADAAGVVEAVGDAVTEFKPGDAVFGEIPGRGSFAEYAIASEAALAHKPERVAFEAAAAAPLAGFTAIQGLRHHGEVKAGDRVLVNGASGGVGTFAVQYAKSVGAEVTGVCSARNHEMVASIGADHLIDYHTSDFTRTGKQYDVIYDAVGNRTPADLARALAPGGRAVIAGYTTFGMLLLTVATMRWVSRGGERWVGMMDTAEPNKADLLVIQDLLASGAVKPVIDRTYPLIEAADAIRYLETMRARGKVILDVGAAA
ncbi:MAG: NAD(P)-dependent alcohol dehydrogenase [Chloroflexota bacterium]